MHKIFDKIFSLESNAINSLMFIGFLLLYPFSYAQTTSVSPTLLPGAKVYDVTKPQNWGGTLSATPNNPTDDDALAINQAIQEAVKFILKKSKRKGEVFQQVIFIPKGDYHLASPIILPRTDNNRENAIWIYGEGSTQSRFILKSATEIGLFGLPISPNHSFSMPPIRMGRRELETLIFSCGQPITPSSYPKTNQMRWAYLMAVQTWAGLEISS